jgi:DNA-3-methyladenine glycosylase II
MNSKIVTHFQKTDPILYRLLSRMGEPKIKLIPRPRRFYFQALCADIISQQLSGHVGDIFWSRFIKLFPQKKVTPAGLLNLPDTALRGIGISNSKVTFLKSLADHFENQKIDFKNLPLLTDEDVIGELTKIKGIGRWTAEMFLMFSLARQDVFSAGDQGLKNAIKKYYSKTPDPAIWSPYRTYACLILWKSIEL